jgi:PhzF family phenazine biosynthesis protein
MKIKYYHVDAFSNQVFSGNPAGVCPLDFWLPDETMQKIAAENNLSETAFFVKQNGTYQLRWFTPLSEVDLCGHATLASAYVIKQFQNYDDSIIRFESLSGMLKVEAKGNLFILDFPSRPPERLQETEELIKGLGGAPREFLKARDVMVVYSNADEIKNIKPDFKLLEKVEGLGIIATAPGDDVDFVSRFFAPRVGVNEDPVTGSSHCTLIPYWAKRLGKHNLHAHQLSKRGGELFCELVGDRVKIGGHAVIYMQGQIEI